MLAIEVSFLLGRYTATDFRDRERAEWPPHPDRLFSALVASMYASGAGESARAALLWLESLPPPQLSADPAPAHQEAVTVFVPINDPAEDYLPHRAERQPRTFPSAVPAAQNAGDCSTVWFVWPDAQPDAILRQLLEVVAKGVTYLGSSRSPVQVRLTDAPPPPNWFPDEDGSEVLRVPRKGRLEALDWQYRNGLRPSVGAFQPYRCGERPAPASIAEGVFGEMVVFRLQGPVPMEIETTMKLTDALRAAVQRRSQEVMGAVPELLSGHADDGRPSSKPHAAYVSLPFVSDTQEHADGRILGVAVVLPRDIASAQRRQALQTLLRVDHLAVPGVGRLNLERSMPGQVLPYNLRPATWTAPRRYWASVTPMLLDRFPKRNGRGIEAIVARSCENVGLPRPVETRVGRYSPLYGVEPSCRYVTHRQGAVGRLHAHVRLTFGQEVRGPMLLGAGRYFGLGLMRPLQEEPIS